MKRPPTLLLLNGELGDPARVRALSAKCRGIVCADGGARHAVRLGIKPRFVVGDMDSLPPSGPASRKALGNAVYWCDFDENRSDLEKALDFILEIGSGPVWIAGARGGRLDHELVNLALLERYAGRMDLFLLGDRQDARLLMPGVHRIPFKKKTVFSLVAVGPSEVSLSGAHYCLRRQTLPPGSRGLSNRALGPVRLTVHSGLLWLIAERLA